MSRETRNTAYEGLDESVLRRWPLPMPPADGDKEERGRVLIVAGSSEMPGVAVLCANAALRAGAGKVTIATGAQAAAGVALALPECRVISLPEKAGGGLADDAARSLDGISAAQDAILIGPGMQDEAAVLAFTRAATAKLKAAKLVLDAYAMGLVADYCDYSDHSARRAVPPANRVLLTPHAGELAHLTGIAKEAIAENPEPLALRAAEKWNAIVALKGAVTLIATAAGRGWRHRGEAIGLSASGTGDALAGIIVGLAARGACLEQAAAWGVVLHAQAARCLASRLGPIGYLARELPAEIPALMHRLRPLGEAGE